MSLRVRLHRLGRHSRIDDIEPSCGVLDVMRGVVVERRIVVDCGAGTGHGRDDGLPGVPDLSLFDDGRPIDAVLVTHAHHDHIGSLPLLVRHLGDDAPVIMTRPSAMALRYILRQEAANPNDPRFLRRYSGADADEIARRIKELRTAGEHEILPGLRVWAHPAGHISGACSYTLDVDGQLIHYAGDRCDHDQPSVLGAEPLPPAWHPGIVAGSDCTYGADTAAPVVWGAEMDRLAELCRQALADGRRMLIYTFALHRAGVIAHELQRRGLADSGRVCLDGSACRFARMFAGPGHLWSPRDRPLAIDRITMLGKRQEREAARRNRGGLVVIAPPGMGGPGGVGSWWRRDILPDPDAIVVFTGYLAAASDGSVILQAAAKREAQVNFIETDRQGRRQGVSLMLRCRIERVRLGGHNGRQATVQWFRDVAPELAVLSHGSVNALASVEAALAGSGIKLVRSDLEPVTVIDL